MRLDRATRRLSSAIAALAMLFSALAPALAQGWSVAPAWGEVCSATSTTPADAAPGGGAALRVGHCPWCALHAPTLAPPPAALATPEAPTPWRQAHEASPGAPRSEAVWLGAQPRAPPPLR